MYNISAYIPLSSSTHSGCQGPPSFHTACLLPPSGSLLSPRACTRAGSGGVPCEGLPPIPIAQPGADTNGCRGVVFFLLWHRVDCIPPSGQGCVAIPETPWSVGWGSTPPKFDIRRVHGLMGGVHQWLCNLNLNFPLHGAVVGRGSIPPIPRVPAPPPTRPSCAAWLPGMGNPIGTKLSLTQTQGFSKKHCAKTNFFVCFFIGFCYYLVLGCLLRSNPMADRCRFLCWGLGQLGCPGLRWAPRAIPIPKATSAIGRRQLPAVAYTQWCWICNLLNTNAVFQFNVYTNY